MAVVKKQTEEYVTRAEAAELMNISLATLIKREKQGLFGQTFQKRMSGPGRAATLYSLAAVEKAMKTRAAREADNDEPTTRSTERGKSMRAPKNGHERKEMEEAFTAMEAADVFEALNAGTSLLTCVTQMGLHPRKVRAIAREYEDLSGALVVTSEVMKVINELPVDGAFPITKPEALLELLRFIIATADEAEKRKKPCGMCGKRPALLCKECALPYVKRKLQRELATQESTAGEASEEAPEEETEEGAVSAPAPAGSSALS